jgi:hypothetical protein
MRTRLWCFSAAAGFPRCCERRLQGDLQCLATIPMKAYFIVLTVTKSLRITYQVYLFRFVMVTRVSLSEFQEVAAADHFVFKC